MSIALENSSGSVNTGATVNIGTGTNRIVVYTGFTASGSDSITAVSVGSLALTKVGSHQGPGGNRFITMWAGYPTQTGSQTLTIIGTEAGGVVNEYTGVKQTLQPKNFVSSSGTQNGGTITQPVTANSTDWILGGAGYDVGTVTVGTNTTSRSSAGSSIIADSNGVVSPTALNYNLQSGSSGAYTSIGAALDSDIHIVFSRSLSDSMMNNASRFVTIVTSNILSRIVSVSIMNSASRFVSVSSRVIKAWINQVKSALGTWTNDKKS